mmetsp:Transcript_28739/g.70680  ORF Transcript_28739/g.70680 Transcript_28739/m.70680 type:complete len:98 (+) Transcript_28739:1-294(+)
MVRWWVDASPTEHVAGPPLLASGQQNTASHAEHGSDLGTDLERCLEDEAPPAPTTAGEAPLSAPRPLDLPPPTGRSPPDPYGSYGRSSPDGPTGPSD